MVNQNSPTFLFFERAGELIAKVARYILVGSLFMYFGEKLKPSGPSPVGPPPSSPPPSSPPP